MNKFDNFMVAMSCYRLDILESFPSKRSSQIRMDFLSNCKPITKKRVRSYTFGFQGQELDNELKGTGNSINYKYRMHDPRLGRFFAVDPLAAKYAYNSTYAFSENRVIDGVELEGLEFVRFSGETIDGSQYNTAFDQYETDAIKFLKPYLNYITEEQAKMIVNNIQTFSINILLDYYGEIHVQVDPGYEHVEKAGSFIYRYNLDCHKPPWYTRFTINLIPIYSGFNTVKGIVTGTSMFDEDFGTVDAITGITSTVIGFSGAVTTLLFNKSFQQLLLPTMSKQTSDVIDIAVAAAFALYDTFNSTNTSEHKEENYNYSTLLNMIVNKLDITSSDSTIE